MPLELARPLWYSNAAERTRCALAMEIMSEFPSFDWTQPSPKKAPWHLHGLYISDEGVTTIVNFYPHKLKMQVAGGLTVAGARHCRNLLRAVLDGTFNEVFPMERLNAQP